MDDTVTGSALGAPMLESIRTQVMWNRLVSVVEEQAQALLRTAFGSVAREAGDLSAGVYDIAGRMLAQAVTGTPGHVNTMAVAVGHFLEPVVEQPTANGLSPPHGLQRVAAHFHDIPGILEDGQP